MGFVRIKLSLCPACSEHSLNSSVLVYTMPGAGTNTPQNSGCASHARNAACSRLGASTWSCRARAAPLVGSSSSVSADSFPFKQRMRKERRKGHIYRAKKWPTSTGETSEAQLHLTGRGARVICSTNAAARIGNTAVSPARRPSVLVLA